MSGRGYGPRASLARSDDSDINLDCIGLRDALPVRKRRNSAKRSPKINVVKAAALPPTNRSQSGTGNCSRRRLKFQCGAIAHSGLEHAQRPLARAVANNLFDMRTSMTCLGRPDDADADHGVVALASENERRRNSIRRPNSARTCGAHNKRQRRDRDSRLD